MTIPSNPHVQWRLDVARKLAEKIRAFPGVQAIVVGGSVARDYADAYSDLELPIFWDELPRMRRAWLSSRHCMASSCTATTARRWKTNC